MKTFGVGKRRLDSAVGEVAVRRRRVVRIGRSESGQALIEFAIVFPLLVVLFAGIVDFGLAFNTWNTVQNSAREGARIAAVSTSAPTIKSRAKLTGGSIDLSAANVTLFCQRPPSLTFTECGDSLVGDGGTCTGGPCGTARTWNELEGDIVEVRVSHAYNFITPLPRLVGLGSSVTVKAAVQTRFEG